MLISDYNPEIIWLVIGVICLVIEFAGIPGIGFLFLGLGALTSAVLIYLYPPFISNQYSYFGLLSFLWFVLLWWPLKKYASSNKGQPKFFDIVGSEVELVGTKLLPGELGQVKWSGTIMNARLDSGEREAHAGERLYIKSVEGNVVILSRTTE